MYDPRFIRTNFSPGRLAPCFCGSGSKFKACCGKFCDDRDPPHGVEIIRSFLSPEKCRDWTEYCAGQPGEALDVYTLDQKNQDLGLAQSRSSNRVTDRVSMAGRRQEMDDLIAGALTGEVSKRLDRRFSWFEKPQLLKYSTGGYFKKHADAEFRIPGSVDWVKNVDRDISILLYLNDDFEGGALLFNHFNYYYRPRAGDLVFFPSDHRYEHEARPLKSGVRYVVVSWAAFEGELRSQETQMPGNISLN